MRHHPPPPPLRAGRVKPLDPAMLAVQALGFLADDPRRLADFLALTGFDAASLRESARRPDFARGVLSHVMADEPLLLGFAAHLGLPPATVERALRQALGPDEG